MRYFLTSDPHFGHANIIRYCMRPFSDCEKMDEALIKNWNQRVKPEDSVFILGDFCFKNKQGIEIGASLTKNANYYLQKLNGEKILIKGNHDGPQSTKTIISGLLLEFANQKIWCTHDPKDANLNYEINFIGHVHQNWLIKKFKNTILFNVGVDVHKYMPITMDEALQEIRMLLKIGHIEEYCPYQED
jgi:calcineurin-like phosphoesterase family protein